VNDDASDDNSAVHGTTHRLFADGGDGWPPL